MSSNTTVAVCMGGPSAEREVSLNSGRAVATGLREAGFSVVELEIDQTLGAIPPEVDVVFPALHGAYGEDGVIQAELERRGLPYVGTEAAHMMASFDKLQTKSLLVEAGLNTPAYAVVTDAAAPCPLPFPVVVKPPLQGSSVGVHKVWSEAEWGAALADVLSLDKNALVEALVEGREMTVGVLSGEALPVVEIRAEGGTYDYAAKYLTGKTEYLVPAPVDDALTRKMQRDAEACFALLGCRDLARIDFLVTPEGESTMLECNSLPGFTATSLLPKAAAANGMSFATLCQTLVQGALEREVGACEKT